jgi:hypothetical protein
MRKLEPIPFVFYPEDPLAPNVMRFYASLIKPDDPARAAYIIERANDFDKWRTTNVE